MSRSVASVRLESTLDPFVIENSQKSFHSVRTCSFIPTEIGGSGSGSGSGGDQKQKQPQPLVLTNTQTPSGGGERAFSAVASRVMAYHVCMYSELITRDANKFCRSIASQLCLTVPGYNDLLFPPSQPQPQQPVPIAIASASASGSGSSGGSGGAAPAVAVKQSGRTNPMSVSLQALMGGDSPTHAFITGILRPLQKCLSLSDSKQQSNNTVYRLVGRSVDLSMRLFCLVV